MEFIIVEEQAFELIRHKHQEFISQVQAICKETKMEEQWLDNQEVCHLLHISQRSLQNYREEAVSKETRQPFLCIFVDISCIYHLYLVP